MVGLSLEDDANDSTEDNPGSLNTMDQASTSLVAKAAEAELEKEIASLQEQLLSAQEALERLKICDDRESKGSSPSNRAATSLTGGPPQRPPGKRGYLFRWMDRSIGWSGTKWALRFVALEGGRISYYGTHTDMSPRYVLTLSGCAVRDEGWKRNRRHSSWRKGVDPALEEPGAYFFVFSIYQRKDGDYTDDSEIAPLLRFSTPSLAEKNQWIQLIAEACAWCETDDFIADESNRAAEILMQQQQQALMSQAMPEAKEGTLPPLIFAPPPIKPPAKRPSFHKRTPSQAKLFKSLTQNVDADKIETQKKGYPPSKPMHRSAAPSYLSFDAPPQNYRGLFNLSMIILFLSSFRLLLGTIRQHGFVLTRFFRQLQDVREIRRDPWQEAPFVSGFLLQVLFVVLGFVIEWLMGHGKLNSTIGMILHHINAHSALFIPMSIVWSLIDHPAIGAILLLHATITWMKLLSYAHANEDYRLGSTTKSGFKSFKASLALVENLDPMDATLTYPKNITLGNLFYFWCAPTLTYQIAFPKYPRVRVWVVMGILVRMVVAVTLFTFLAAQVVTPALESLVADLEATHGTITAQIMAEYWLKLAIANTYLWLLMFYIYFHLYLNLFAELLRFGDRVFYKDWWNSSEVSAYWRLWNTPVHYWLIRHVYFPCLRLKLSRTFATFVVFSLSAVMHEVLVSVPFHMIRPWSFLGMMMQMPLVGLTKFLARMYPGSSLGNIIFWLSFCLVGQPCAVLLYTVDYQYGKHHSGMELFDQDECRVMWRGHCMIR